MFTGLIEEVGIVKSIEKASNGIYLTIHSKKVIEDVKNGDSISIDGACQTVTKFSGDTFTVFASKITCEITTLGGFIPGKKVNLERAMMPSGRFGGHFVQGHVDGMGKIRSISKSENGIAIEIEVPSEILKYIAAKGSVAVDGISLTVVDLRKTGFAVYIIPETIKNTTLPEKQGNSYVNIEADILAKYIEKMLDVFKGKNDNKEDKNINIKRLLFEKGFI